MRASHHATILQACGHPNRDPFEEPRVNAIVKPSISQAVANAPHRCVALETTLLAHGVPRADAPALADRLSAAVADAAATPAAIGVLEGVPTIGMSGEELARMLATPDVAKCNTANLGVLIHRRATAATTVSTTAELAALAGIRVFATGAIGGVHRGLADRLDISSDLAALARFPVAVVSSGVKGLLDVLSTREALESLGVPVVGYQTSTFPAFYVRASAADVDARFDDPAELADYAAWELARTGRGVLICNPAPESHAFTQAEFEEMLAEAERTASGASGRDVTPQILGSLHTQSGGRTLACNIALAESNAKLAGRLASAMPGQ